jgi:threonine aldolase
VAVADEPQVNMAFVAADDAVADRLADAGLCFYRMGGGVIRLVTSFATTAAEIDDAVQRWGEAR